MKVSAYRTQVVVSPWWTGIFSYLNPVFLWSLIWGQTSIISKLYRNIKSGFDPKSRKRKVLLAWMEDVTGQHVADLDTVWKDGRVLRDIIRLSCPDSISDYYQVSGMSFRQGQTLITRCLQLQPAFYEADFLRTDLTPELENRLFRYLSTVRQALNRRQASKNTSLDDDSDADPQVADEYIARGMGLLMASRNRRAMFYIYSRDGSSLYNIRIEIQGPDGDHGLAIVTADIPELAISTSIPIDYRLTPEYLRVSYQPRSLGNHELSLTKYGYFIPGSPFHVCVDDASHRPGKRYASIEWLTIDEEEEKKKRDEIKRKSRVKCRIVDFVTEKMYLTDDGKLVKIPPDTPSSTASCTHNLPYNAASCTSNIPSGIALCTPNTPSNVASCTTKTPSNAGSCTSNTHFSIASCTPNTPSSVASCTTKTSSNAVQNKASALIPFKENFRPRARSISPRKIPKEKKSYNSLPYRAVKKNFYLTPVKKVKVSDASAQVKLEEYKPNSSLVFREKCKVIVSTCDFLLKNLPKQRSLDIITNASRILESPARCGANKLSITDSEELKPTTEAEGTEPAPRVPKLSLTLNSNEDDDDVFLPDQSTNKAANRTRLFLSNVCDGLNDITEMIVDNENQTSTRHSSCSEARLSFKLQGNTKSPCKQRSFSSIHRGDSQEYLVLEDDILTVMDNVIDVTGTNEYLQALRTKSEEQRIEIGTNELQLETKHDAKFKVKGKIVCKIIEQFEAHKISPVHGIRIDNVTEEDKTQGETNKSSSVHDIRMDNVREEDNTQGEMHKYSSVHGIRMDNVREEDKIQGETCNSSSVYGIKVDNVRKEDKTKGELGTTENKESSVMQRKEHQTQNDTEILFDSNKKSKAGPSNEFTEIKEIVEINKSIKILNKEIKTSGICWHNFKTEQENYYSGTSNTDNDNEDNGKRIQLKDKQNQERQEKSSTKSKVTKKELIGEDTKGEYILLNNQYGTDITTESKTNDAKETKSYVQEFEIDKTNTSTKSSSSNIKKVCSLFESHFTLNNREKPNITEQGEIKRQPNVCSFKRPSDFKPRVCSMKIGTQTCELKLNKSEFGGKVEVKETVPLGSTKDDRLSHPIGQSRIRSFEICQSKSELQEPPTQITDLRETKNLELNSNEYKIKNKLAERLHEPFKNKRSKSNHNETESINVPPKKEKDLCIVEPRTVMEPELVGEVFRAEPAVVEELFRAEPARVEEFCRSELAAVGADLSAANKMCCSVSNNERFQKYIYSTKGNEEAPVKPHSQQPLTEGMEGVTIETYSQQPLTKRMGELTIKTYSQPLTKGMEETIETYSQRPLAKGMEELTIDTDSQRLSTKGAEEARVKSYSRLLIKESVMKLKGQTDLFFDNKINPIDTCEEESTLNTLKCNDVSEHQNKPKPKLRSSKTLQNEVNKSEYKQDQFYTKLLQSERKTNIERDTEEYRRKVTNTVFTRSSGIGVRIMPRGWIQENKEITKEVTQTEKTRETRWSIESKGIEPEKDFKINAEECIVDKGKNHLIDDVELDVRKDIIVTDVVEVSQEFEKAMLTEITESVITKSNQSYHSISTDVKEKFTEVERKTVVAKDTAEYSIQEELITDVAMEILANFTEPVVTESSLRFDSISDDIKEEITKVVVPETSIEKPVIDADLTKSAVTECSKNCDFISADVKDEITEDVTEGNVLKDSKEDKVTVAEHTDEMKDVLEGIVVEDSKKDGGIMAEDTAEFKDITKGTTGDQRKEVEFIISEGTAEIMDVTEKNVGEDTKEVELIMAEDTAEIMDVTKGITVEDSKSDEVITIEDTAEIKDFTEGILGEDCKVVENIIAEDKAEIKGYVAEGIVGEDSKKVEDLMAGYKVETKDDTEGIVGEHSIDGEASMAEDTIEIKDVTESILVEYSKEVQNIMAESITEIKDVTEYILVEDSKEAEVTMIEDTERIKVDITEEIVVKNSKEVEVTRTEDNVEIKDVIEGIVGEDNKEVEVNMHEEIIEFEDVTEGVVVEHNKEVEVTKAEDITEIKDVIKGILLVDSKEVDVTLAEDVTEIKDVTEDILVEDNKEVEVTMAEDITEIKNVIKGILLANSKEVDGTLAEDVTEIKDVTEDILVEDSKEIEFTITEDVTENKDVTEAIVVEDSKEVEVTMFEYVTEIKDLTEGILVEDSKEVEVTMTADIVKIKKVTDGILVEDSNEVEVPVAEDITDIKYVTESILVEDIKELEVTIAEDVTEIKKVTEDILVEDSNEVEVTVAEDITDIKDVTEGILVEYSKEVEVSMAEDTIEIKDVTEGILVEDGKEKKIKVVNRVNDKHLTSVKSELKINSDKGLPRDYNFPLSDSEIKTIKSHRNAVTIETTETKTEEKHISVIKTLLFSETNKKQNDLKKEIDHKIFITKKVPITDRIREFENIATLSDTSTKTDVQCKNNKVQNRIAEFENTVLVNNLIKKEFNKIIETKLEQNEKQDIFIFGGKEYKYMTENDCDVLDSVIILSGRLSSGEKIPVEHRDYKESEVRGEPETNMTVNSVLETTYLEQTSKLQENTDRTNKSIDKCKKNVSIRNVELQTETEPKSETKHNAITDTMTSEFNEELLQNIQLDSDVVDDEQYNERILHKECVKSIDGQSQEGKDLDTIDSIHEKSLDTRGMLQDDNMESIEKEMTTVGSICDMLEIESCEYNETYQIEDMTNIEKETINSGPNSAIINLVSECEDSKTLNIEDITGNITTNEKIEKENTTDTNNLKTKTEIILSGPREVTSTVECSDGTHLHVNDLFTTEGNKSLGRSEDKNYKVKQTYEIVQEEQTGQEVLSEIMENKDAILKDKNKCDTVLNEDGVVCTNKCDNKFNLGPTFGLEVKVREDCDTDIEADEILSKKNGCNSSVDHSVHANKDENYGYKTIGEDQTEENTACFEEGKSSTSLGVEEMKLNSFENHENKVTLNNKHERINECNTRDKDEVIRDIRNVGDEINQDSINVGDEVNLDSIDISDEIIQDSINVGDEVNLDSIDIGDEIIRDSIYIGDEVNLDMIDIGDEINQDSINVGDEVNLDSIDIGDEIIRDSINVGNEVNLDRIDIGDEINQDSINVGDEVNLDSIDIGDEINQDSINVGNEVNLDMIDIGDEINQDSINVGDEVNLDSIDIGDEINQDRINVGDEVNLDMIDIGDEINQDSINVGDEVNLDSIDIGDEINQDSINVGNEVNLDMIDIGDEINQYSINVSDEVNLDSIYVGDEVIRDSIYVGGEINRDSINVNDEINRDSTDITISEEVTEIKDVTEDLLVEDNKEVEVTMAEDITEIKNVIKGILLADSKGVEVTLAEDVTEIKDVAEDILMEDSKEIKFTITEYVTEIKDVTEGFYITDKYITEETFEDVLIDVETSSLDDLDSIIPEQTDKAFVQKFNSETVVTNLETGVTFPDMNNYDFFRARSIDEEILNIEDEVNRDSIHAGNEVFQDNIDISDEVIRDNINIFDEVIQDSIDVGDEVIRDSTDISDEVIQDSMDTDDEVIRDSRSIGDEVIRNSIGISDEVIRNSIDIGDEVIRDSIIIGDEVIRDCIDVGNEVNRDTIDVGDEVIQDSINTSNEVIQDCINVCDEVIRDSRNVGDEINHDSINVDNDVNRDSIDIGVGDGDEVNGNSRSVGDGLNQDSIDVSDEEIQDSRDVDDEVIQDSKDSGDEVIRDSRDTWDALIQDNVDVGYKVIRDSLNVGDEVIRDSTDVSDEVIRDSINICDEVINDSTDIGKEVIQDSIDIGKEAIRDRIDVGDEVIRDSRDVGDGDEVNGNSRSVGDGVNQDSIDVNDEEIQDSKDASDKVIRDSRDAGDAIIRDSVDVGYKVIRDSINVGDEVIRDSTYVSDEVIRDSINICDEVIYDSTDIGKEVIQDSIDIGKEVIRDSINVGDEVIRDSINVYIVEQEVQIKDTMMLHEFIILKENCVISSTEQISEKVSTNFQDTTNGSVEDDLVQMYEIKNEFDKLLDNNKIDEDKNSEAGTLSNTELNEISLVEKEFDKILEVKSNDDKEIYNYCEESYNDPTPLEECLKTPGHERITHDNLRLLVSSNIYLSKQEILSCDENSVLMFAIASRENEDSNTSTLPHDCTWLTGKSNVSYERNKCDLQGNVSIISTKKLNSITPGLRPSERYVNTTCGVKPLFVRESLANDITDIVGDGSDTDVHSGSGYNDTEEYRKQKANVSLLEWQEENTNLNQSKNFTINDQLKGIIEDINDYDILNRNLMSVEKELTDVINIEDERLDEEVQQEIDKLDAVASDDVNTDFQDRHGSIEDEELEEELQQEIEKIYAAASGDIETDFQDKHASIEDEELDEEVQQEIAKLEIISNVTDILEEQVKNESIEEEELDLETQEEFVKVDSTDADEEMQIKEIDKCRKDFFMNNLQDRQKTIEEEELDVKTQEEIAKVEQINLNKDDKVYSILEIVKENITDKYITEETFEDMLIDVETPSLDDLDSITPEQTEKAFIQKFNSETVVTDLETGVTFPDMNNYDFFRARSIDEEILKPIQSNTVSQDTVDDSECSWEDSEIYSQLSESFEKNKSTNDNITLDTGSPQSEWESPTDVLTEVDYAGSTDPSFHLWSSNTEFGSPPDKYNLTDEVDFDSIISAPNLDEALKKLEKHIQYKKETKQESNEDSDVNQSKLDEYTMMDKTIDDISLEISKYLESENKDVPLTSSDLALWSVQGQDEQAESKSDFSVWENGTEDKKRNWSPIISSYRYPRVLPSQRSIMSLIDEEEERASSRAMNSPLSRMLSKSQDSFSSTKSSDRLQQGYSQSSEDSRNEFIGLLDEGDELNLVELRSGGSEKNISSELLEHSIDEEESHDFDNKKVHTQSLNDDLFENCDTNLTQESEISENELLNNMIQLSHENIKTGLKQITRKHSLNCTYVTCNKNDETEAITGLELTEEMTPTENCEKNKFTNSEIIKIGELIYSDQLEIEKPPENFTKEDILEVEKTSFITPEERVDNYVAEIFNKCNSSPLLDSVLTAQTEFLLSEEVADTFSVSERTQYWDKKLETIKILNESEGTNKKTVNEIKCGNVSHLVSCFMEVPLEDSDVQSNKICHRTKETKTKKESLNKESKQYSDNEMKRCETEASSCLAMVTASCDMLMTKENTMPDEDENKPNREAEKVLSIEEKTEGDKSKLEELEQVEKDAIPSNLVKKWTNYWDDFITEQNENQTSKHLLSNVTGILANAKHQFEFVKNIKHEDKFTNLQSVKENIQVSENTTSLNKQTLNKNNVSTIESDESNDNEGNLEYFDKNDMFLRRVKENHLKTKNIVLERIKLFEKGIHMLKESESDILNNVKLNSYSVKGHTHATKVDSLMADNDSETINKPLLMTDNVSESINTSLLMADNGSENTNTSLLMANNGSETINTSLLNNNLMRPTERMRSYSTGNIDIMGDVQDKQNTSDQSEYTNNDNIDCKLRFERAKQFFKILEKGSLGGRQDRCYRSMPRMDRPTTLVRYSKPSIDSDSGTDTRCQRKRDRIRGRRKKKKEIKVRSAPSSDTESWKRISGREDNTFGSERHKKLSERFHVKGLFRDISGDFDGFFRGIPHREAVLASLRSVDDINVSPYEMDYKTLRPSKSVSSIPEGFQQEYPYLPTTPPSRYRPRSALEFHLIPRSVLIDLNI